MAITNVSAYEEFVEFIISAPTLEQITEFRLTEATELYIHNLLEANRTRTLTPEEAAELDEFLRIEHLMRKVKLRAYEKLQHS